MAKAHNADKGCRRTGDSNESEIQRRYFYSCHSYFPSAKVEEIAKWDARSACKRI